MDPPMIESEPSRKISKRNRHVRGVRQVLNHVTGSEPLAKIGDGSKWVVWYASTATCRLMWTADLSHSHEFVPAGYCRDLASRYCVELTRRSICSSPASVYPMPHWKVSATVTLQERGRYRRKTTQFQSTGILFLNRLSPATFSKRADSAWKTPHGGESRSVARCPIWQRVRRRSMRLTDA